MTVDEVRIHRLRARCPEDVEPLHARLRLSHLLGTADVRPPGLPPQAILLLRRLNAPQPLAIDGLRVPVTWEQSLRGEVERQMRSAVRPQRGRIPAGAEAVLFADESEMLACLGVLAVRQDMEARWVWESAAGPRLPVPAPDALTRVWIEHPRALPAVLHRLDTWGEAVPVLQSLPEPSLNALFAVIVSEFGLSVRVEDLAAPELLPPAASPPADELSSMEGAPARKAMDTRAVTPPAAWRDPSRSERVLLPAARGLLLLTRMLVRFSTLSEEARSALSAIHAETPGTDSASPLTRPAAGSPVSVAAAETPSADVGDRNLHAGVTPQSADQGVPVPPFPASAPLESKPEARGVSPASPAPSIPASSETPAAEEGAAERDSSGATDEPYPWDGLAGISTKTGGVFYLLNLFLRQDAPTCYDAEFNLSEHLSLWGLMQGAGQWLLRETGEEGEEFRRDALWPLFARLDGRLPDEPIAPHLPHRERTLQTVYERLRSELDAMLNAVTDDEAAKPERYRELLCRPATVYATRTHVDVVLPLDAIYLPARRAGLDASPGWVPELMRVILFHFI